MTAWLRAISPDLLPTHIKAEDPRLASIVQVLPAAQSADDLHDSLSELNTGFAILGYPDDEGIRLNGGRLGAAEAPQEIRRALYKMTPSCVNSDTPTLYELGDLNVEGATLPERHARAEKLIHTALHNGHRTLSFGGGHDYGFPDAVALVRWAKSKNLRPLVINFDAHLDVRPVESTFHSGTPFRRLLEAEPDTEFIEIGLQAHCNSRAHRAWLESVGGRVVFEEDRRARRESLLASLHRLLGENLPSRRPTFLSIDIDAFSSAYAPGASASWPTGFEPEDFFPCLEWCLARLDVRGLGIYEVSPRLDLDARTSKLAAVIAHRFLSR
ncbi:MAG TPA: formimidoylglutamase [Pseudobdellovibrionaceae bacterium]|nr:formimidoylglutamase [Pseudobdellovibrionaceae bacterium]